MNFPETQGKCLQNSWRDYIFQVYQKETSSHDYFEDLANKLLLLMFSKFKNSQFQENALSSCFQGQYYYPIQHLPAGSYLLKQQNKMLDQLNPNNKPWAYFVQCAFWQCKPDFSHNCFLKNLVKSLFTIEKRPKLYKQAFMQRSEDHMNILCKFIVGCMFPALCLVYFPQANQIVGNKEF